MTIFEVFILLGGVGLFLFGMTTMSSGLRAACGDRLRGILEKATKNRPVSVLVGVGVTVLMQSSSATDVMVIGFVSSGLMTLGQAIGVIMGANIGTTVTAQITAFDIGAYAPLILFIGAIAALFFKNKTARSIGSVILGFGMLFEGITLMKSAIAPLAQTEEFIDLVSKMSNPALLVIFGVLFTALLQSSSSSTVIFQAFAMQGIITYDTAVWLIIGAAIGSVTPNLLASLTTNREGKRCALLNLIFNLIRAALIITVISVFPQVLTWLQALSPGNPARQIANTHTIFALVSVLLMLPFSKYIVKLTEKLVPYTADETRRAADQKLVYLVQTDRVPPAMVISQAHLEIARMGRIALDNLKTSTECFFARDHHGISRVASGEQTVDYLTTEILGKLVELRSTDMSARNMTRLYHMIQVVDDVERISDHAENIAEYEEMMHTGAAKLSDDAMDDLKRLSDLTLRSLEISLSIFENQTFELIGDAYAVEEKVDETKDEIVRRHIERLMKEQCDPRGGVIFTDMSIDLERCSDHAMNIATALKY